MKHHKNVVAEHDNWVIMRDASSPIIGNPFSVYHAHPGKDPRWRGEAVYHTTGRVWTWSRTHRRAHMQQYLCGTCREYSPDVITGYMQMLYWSFEDDN